MRKVILKMHVLLDGYLQAASGDVMGWVFRSYDDDLKVWEIDTLVAGGNARHGSEPVRRNGCVLANFNRSIRATDE